MDTEKSPYPDGLHAALMNDFPLHLLKESYGESEADPERLVSFASPFSFLSGADLDFTGVARSPAPDGDLCYKVLAPGVWVEFKTFGETEEFFSLLKILCKDGGAILRHIPPGQFETLGEAVATAVGYLKGRRDCGIEEKTR